MDSGAAPEFIPEQSLYYPVDGSYFGYYSAELPGEWDDHHSSFGVDGQDLYYSAIGSQSESLPYAYLTPSYSYSPSPYNPYNPYIPCAVVGTDGRFIGTQQYFTNPSYEQLVSSPAYIPAIVQSSSDHVPNGSPNPSGINICLSTAGCRTNSVGTEYTPLLASANVVAASQRVALGNPLLESSKSSPHQIQTSAKVSDGSLVHAAESKQYLSHGSLTAGSVPYVTQATNNFRNGRISSVHSPSGITMPANSGFTNNRPSVCGWSSVDRYTPRFQYNRSLINGRSPHILGDQNKGPRAKGSEGDATSAIAVQASATKAVNTNLLGNITINPNQYNRDDFPVDYPVAKFFVIKSYTEDDVHKSIKYNVWSSTPYGNKKLDIAYEDAQRISVGKPRNCPVFLFFSVNTSGQFCGVAEMIGRVDFYKNMEFWQQDKWIGSFPVRWHIIKDVPNTSLRHILIENNEYIPVTSSRDTQEVTYIPGMDMLKIFKYHPLISSLLDDYLFYEERERIMRQQRSKLLGRNHHASLFSPVCLPSNGFSGTVARRPVACVKQLNGTVGDPPKEDEKQPGVLPDRSLKSDRKVPSDEVGEPPKDGRKQDDSAVRHHPKAGREHLNAHSLRSDQNSTGPHTPIASCKVGSCDQEVSPKMVAANPTDAVADVESNPVGVSGLDLAKKIGSLSIEDKVCESSCSSSPSDATVTIGTMPIKINKNRDSSSTKFTVGSIPA